MPYISELRYMLLIIQYTFTESVRCHPRTPKSPNPEGPSVYTEDSEFGGSKFPSLSSTDSTSLYLRHFLNCAAIGPMIGRSAPF